MGSTACHRPKGMTDKAFFEAEYTSMRVLATARAGNVIYAACSKRPEFCSADDDASEVFALVMPFSISRGEHNFCWKEQDETCGPGDARCPFRILDMLTPTRDRYAMDWRERCLTNIAKVAEAKRRANAVTAGTVIRTPEKCFFGKRYGSYDTFRYTGKGNTFVAVHEGTPVLTVSLGRAWKELDYEVVN